MPVIPSLTPPREALLALLRYDPATGTLYWRQRSREGFVSDRIWNSWNAKNADHVALNNIDPAGYRRGALHSRSYAAHRLIWKMMTGEEPDKIDHVNGIRSDNRFENLRSVTAQENQKNMRRFSNNTTGRTGVIFDKRRGTWRAEIGVWNETIALGSFVTFEEACAARQGAEKTIQFHPSHGSDKR